MSDILSSMVTHLQANTALAALVGTRMYPMVLPAPSTSAATTFPALTYQLIDEPARTTHDGGVNYKARVQIDVYGTTYKTARAAADAVHTAMHGFRGSWNAFLVGNVFRKRKMDEFEPDTNLNRVSMDFAVSYREE